MTRYSAIWKPEKSNRWYYTGIVHKCDIWWSKESSVIENSWRGIVAIFCAFCSWLVFGTSTTDETWSAECHWKNHNQAHKLQSKNYTYISRAFGNQCDCFVPMLFPKCSSCVEFLFSRYKNKRSKIKDVSDLSILTASLSPKLREAHA